MTRFAMFFAALFALSLGACGEETPEVEEHILVPADVDHDEPSEEAPAEEEISAEDVPIPEDFEDEVAAEITADNLEDAIRALESEIAADE